MKINKEDTARNVSDRLKGAKACNNCLEWRIASIIVVEGEEEGKKAYLCQPCFDELTKEDSKPIRGH